MTKGKLVEFLLTKLDQQDNVALDRFYDCREKFHSKLWDSYDNKNLVFEKLKDVSKYFFLTIQFNFIYIGSDLRKYERFCACFKMCSVFKQNLWKH